MPTSGTSQARNRKWSRRKATEREPDPNEMARQIAEQMLRQRVKQLEVAGLYLVPGRNGDGRDGESGEDRESGKDATPRVGRSDTFIGLTFPVRVITAAVAGLVALLVTSLLLELPAPVALALASVVPSAIVMMGVLIAHNRERRRHGAETGAHLERELGALHGEPDPFPRDAAYALRRAENLVAQADIEIRLLTQRLLRNTALFFVLVIPAIATAAFEVFGDARVQVVALGTTFEALMAVMLMASRQRVRTLESDLREGDYERSLLTDSDSSEARAEILFLKHQFELKRYYDETLRQSGMLSYVGVLCMAAGFVVIGVAFYLIAQEDQPSSQQIMIATLAAAGGVLANFVAVLYLAMHARTVRALTGFHQRLVGTHHVHFGNLLASRVDDGANSRVLERMAIALASRAESDGRSSGGGHRRNLREFVSDLVGTR